jgi:hypothetical protein
MDKEINIRLSRVCGLATRQRVPLTEERFDDLSENERNELFKNSIQAYIECLEVMKEKWKKVAMKIYHVTCLEELQEQTCEVFEE